MREGWRGWRASLHHGGHGRGWVHAWGRGAWQGLGACLGEGGGMMVGAGLLGALGGKGSGMWGAA